MRKLAGWVGALLLLVVLMPLAAGNWSRATTIRLSIRGYSILAAVFLVALALSAALYVRASSSRYGVAELISLRERARDSWLRRGVMMSVAAGIFFAVVSCFYLMGIAPHLRGQTVERQGIVERMIGPGVGNRWCTTFVVVRFAPDFDAKICIEEEGPSRLIPEARGLKQGDPVRVSLKHTFLGVSADLVGAPKGHVAAAVSGS